MALAFAEVLIGIIEVIEDCLDVEIAEEVLDEIELTTINTYDEAIDQGFTTEEAENISASESYPILYNENVTVAEQYIGKLQEEGIDLDVNYGNGQSFDNVNEDAIPDQTDVKVDGEMDQ